MLSKIYTYKLNPKTKSGPAVDVYHEVLIGVSGKQIWPWYIVGKSAAAKIIKSSN